MSETITVEVRVAEHNIRLSTTADKEEQLHRAVELFNEKYDELRHAAPALERSKLLMLAGLEFAQEILKLNKSLQMYSHAELLLKNMVDDLDQEAVSQIVEQK
ncbi:MAG: cell division protein ZapA [Acinetobacter sp.]|nr:cell division protein ZapA [Acinetobacter sp.]